MGCVVFPPCSESFGRKNMYVWSTIFYCIFCIIIAAVPSPAAVAVGRFISGSLSAMPSVVVNGSIEDMFNTDTRIWIVFMNAISTNIGLAGGPIMSGYITTTLGWQWVFYIAAIVTGILAVLMLTIKESRPTLLLAHKVQKLREQTGNKSLEAFNPDHVSDMKVFVRLSLFRPLQLFFTEPIVFTVALMNGACMALIYLFTEALPIIYPLFGFSEAQANLPFVAFSLGILLNIPARFLDRRLRAKLRKQGHVAGPESKLIGLFLGAPVLAGALWLFAWSIPPMVPDVHWIVSVLALFFIGFALNEFATVYAGYIADSYLSYAGSAQAALSMLRSLMGALFPLFTPKMFNSLGNNVAVSVLAAVATVFCVAPVLFSRYGVSLRKRSRFANYSLQVYETSTVEDGGR
ncbi:hypothetical protein N8T08_000167 [Aspergillus melleus]|uniref:Uncharacterized protein n=1 Tax=Aspergillus melleus TaxID=138277 RepID=A0ACC3BHM4_9EURO|nr:hypothetical protein N8T08_000167 [Aspergillus melleus]